MHTAQTLRITAENRDTHSTIRNRIRLRRPTGKRNVRHKKIHANVFLMNCYSDLMAEELQALRHFNKVSSSPCLLKQKVRIVVLIDKAYNQVSFL